MLKEFAVNQNNIATEKDINAFVKGDYLVELYFKLGIIYQMKI